MSKQPKDLKSLQKIWYAKLKKSGFDDIESENGQLRGDASRYIAENPHPNLWEATADYYRLANSFLYDNRFDTELEKTIWEYHANGLSARNIAKVLKQVKVKSLSKNTVWRTIVRLRNDMYDIYMPSRKNR
jgi:hypothetical protein